MLLRQADYIHLGSIQVDFALQLNNGNIMLERPLIEVKVLVELKILHGVYVLLGQEFGVLLVLVEAHVDLNEREYLGETQIEATQQFKVGDEAVGGGEHVLICEQSATAVVLRLAFDLDADADEEGPRVIDSSLATHNPFGATRQLRRVYAWLYVGLAAVAPLGERF